MNNISTLLTIIAMIFVVGNFFVSGIIKLFAKEFSTFIILIVIGVLIAILGIIYHKYLASALLWYLIFSQLVSIFNEILHFTIESKIKKQENTNENENSENKTEEKE